MLKRFNLNRLRGFKFPSKIKLILLGIFLLVTIIESLVLISYINKVYTTTISDISFNTVNKGDDNLLVGSQYIIDGSKGKQISITSANLLFNHTFNTKSNTTTIDPINSIKFSGNNSKDKITLLITTNFNSLSSNLKSSQDISSLTDTNTNFKLLSKTKIDNVVLSQVVLTNPDQAIRVNSKVTSLPVGNISLKYNNCGTSFILSVIYDVKTKSYRFTDIQKFIDSLCENYVTVQVSVPATADCKDCLYFPVDKNHALSQSYIPATVPIDTIPGGQMVDYRLRSDLQQMYNDAVKSSNPLNITSAYRSYNTQIGTFNGWVQSEMAKGESRQTATLNANTYSAYPGHSEHQLGTTVDLNSTRCQAFDLNCHAGNVQLWQWLLDNSYKYGFVLSYPQGKQSLTGYIYEPWHFRWIGKSLASEYITVQNQTYLAQFLGAKQLWIGK